jgi:hypothetical protein
LTCLSSATFKDPWLDRFIVTCSPSFLRRLDPKHQYERSRKKSLSPDKSSRRKNVVSEHSAHCRTCKERVGELLAALYGDCRASHSFAWSANPQDYEGTSIGQVLRQIREGLGQLRGHRDFIKSPQVPPCDFYVPDPRFIVEFDESQHFSRPRLVTLSLYPLEFKAGFPVARWQELCCLIDAKDDTPYDRDERRAWYDTLRDLVPALHGFNPTVRLYTDELQWCALDSDSEEDQERFASVLKDRLPARAV